MRFLCLSCALVFLLLLNTTRLCVAAGDSTQAGQALDSIQQVGQPGDGVYAITEAGPHQRRWGKANHIEQLGGSLQTIINSYVELKTGMNAWSPADQKWIEASDEIEIVAGALGAPGGAVARKAQHQVIIAPRLLASPDPVIDLQMMDGKRLRSHVLGIAYTDTRTGQSIFIAEPRDTGAEVVGRNQVLYADAFDGLDADLRYTMKISSFEQDVVLRQQLPFGDELRKAGFSPESTRVEIWTAFVTDTPPTRHPIEVDGKILEGDEQLDFGPGSMAFGPSQAFKLEDGASHPPVLALAAQTGCRMAMEWATIDGQQFLIESIPFDQVQALTADLPKPQAKAGVHKDLQRALLARQTTGRARPVSLRAQAAPTPSEARQVAQATRRPLAAQKAAVLFDYVLINGATGYRFQGDTTYYVTADAYFFGTNIFEGGTVIKFDRYLGTPGVPRIILRAGPIACETSAYRPAVFTAKDDDSVGEIISGSTGNPGTNYYGYTHLCLWDLGPACYVHDVRFCYAYAGFSDEYRQQSELRHVQFVNCYINVNTYGAAFQLRNALSYNSYYGLVAQYSTLSAENATFNTGSRLIYNVISSAISFTNCLIVAYSDSSGYSGSPNRTVVPTNGVFQAVKGGGHYLPADSPFRDLGTTNIHAGLLTDLKSRTTVAPLVLTTDITVPTTLAPCAGRDLDTPDLGYHYDPLDYLVSNLNVTNATLLLTNGVAVGCYGNYMGFYLLAGSKIISEGTPTTLNQLVRYRTVQESPISLSEPWSHTISCTGSYSPAPEIRARFTRFSMLTPGSGSAHIIPTYGPFVINLRDCQFSSGGLLVSVNTGLTLGINNCLFQRVNSLIGGDTLTCYNNTFFGGTATFSDWPGQTYTVRDNLFDQTTVWQYAYGSWTLGYNGYISGYSRLSPNGPNDVILAASPAYQTSWLGTFYLPSSISLTNAGSRAASVAGLYHYTTQTNQTRQGTNIVDIGFHYVACDNNTGKPLDDDADGWPNYFEDRNGNGLVDSGETNWQSATDMGLKVLITEPKGNSNLP
jgi:hypothetical protein